MRINVTLDDELYEQALAVGDLAMDPPELIR